MTDRSLFTSTSTAPVTGGDYMDNVSEKIGILFDAMTLIPTAITNSGNDYTITLDPTLDGDVVNGMGFYITPNATNTGAVRIRATSGNPYYDVVGSNGAALVADEFASTSIYFVAFIGGDFVVLSTTALAGGGGGGAFDTQDFTASGIWTKPAGIDPDAVVIVDAWGAGGGGGSGTTAGGGGGGGHSEHMFRAGDLGATETVTIGAGGGVSTAGGNSTFGTHLTGYGGGGGSGTTTAVGSGGGGGGTTAAGSNASIGIAGFGGGIFASGGFGGGAGGLGGNVDVFGTLPIDSYHGGGGGGGIRFGTVSVNGADSYHGGGGGASGTAGTGGTSVFGGAGGGGGTSGTQPGGGGGGNSGTGAAGQITVRVIS